MDHTEDSSGCSAFYTYIRHKVQKSWYENALLGWDYAHNSQLSMMCLKLGSMMKSRLV